MPSIDLNCDLGESFGAYTIGMDAEILPYVTSANIACGFHAGDPSVMQKSVLLCKKYGVQVGAHPGLPDLQGFGRRRMAISPAEAEADVMYQIGALKAFCDAAGVPLHHVKPHGALYNMAARDPVLAAAICRATASRRRCSPPRVPRRWPRLPPILPAVPPAFDSLMPPVSGLLAPADRRPELAAAVPDSRPGAKTSLLFGPSGWQVGGTSAAENHYINLVFPLFHICHGANGRSLCQYRYRLRCTSCKYGHQLHVRVLLDSTLNTSSEVSIS